LQVSTGARCIGELQPASITNAAAINPVLIFIYYYSHW